MAAMRIAAVLALSLALLDSAEPGAQPAFPATVASALTQAINQWAARPGHVGVSAAVVLSDGAEWTAAAGFAGAGEPLVADHLIQIASITKTMTAAVVLQLVDEGVLRLDDPLSRWLPPRQHVDPAITLRQLLNHTNGLSNYTTFRALGEAIDANPARVFTPDELLDFIGPPQFAAGASTEYTNTAFVLLGQVVERATGRSIVDLYRQRLWTPLELNGVFLPGFEEPVGIVAMARTGSLFSAPLDHMSRLSIGYSAFGLFATASTVARWGRQLFDGHVISEAMQHEMRQLVPAAGNIIGETGAGLGVRGYRYLGRTQFGHSGGSSFGSSLLLFDPETLTTVAVLANQDAGADHFLLAPALLRIASVD